MQFRGVMLRMRTAGRAGQNRRALAATAAVLAFFLALDRLFPPPQPGRAAPFSTMVVARDGTPLRAFPDRAHVWRHPVALEEVSPLYLEALVAYEDRAYWWHPGVNPWALARAGRQWLTDGRVVSGGSTLTMQVARILDPTPRTVAGKLKQIARALQLEWRYSKREILALYLNYAPMGGVLEGIEAASRGYLGKPARRLTHAEAALLAVLPQAPSLLRPDRHPARARIARDKVLQRMARRWGTVIVTDALIEPVYAFAPREPLLAPLLAQRLRSAANGATRIDTTIDAAAQTQIEQVLLDRARNLPPRVSAAVLVMDNATLEVLAYAGSADFTDAERASHVDMVRAPRSPGSALKPFLYAFALEEGLIHSESLLADAPQSFGGYQPGNFQQSFHGPVSVSEALGRSLNVPAVEVLDRLGSARFVARLRSGGMRLEFPRDATPNLSVILGGAAVTLEELVGAYSALARKGLAAVPRYTAADPVRGRRMMSEGAAFIVREILESGGPVGREVEPGVGVQRGIAWKTGTSFGFRDAWAVGVSERYTVGVWVGRPDGTPNPGFFGANAAAPLLLDVFSTLPDGGAAARAAPRGVTQERICWPLGTRESGPADPRCHVRRTAWALDGAVPATFSDRLRGGEPRYTYHVDAVTGDRVMPECARHAVLRVEGARWPTVLEPWLDPGLRGRVLPPAWSTDCRDAARAGESVKIVGASDGEVVQRAAGNEQAVMRLEARGVRGEINWMVNGRFVARAPAAAGHLLRLAEAGRYDITAFDDRGHYDRISLSVRSVN
jgi:penicillin-binding protein 1C